jgi:transposase
MQAQSLSLCKQLQGALPLVHQFLQRLELPQLLATYIQPPRYVQALDLLLKSVLLRPAALYRIQAWAQTYDGAFRPAAPMGDDALGRALDRLFEADRASLLTALVVQAVRTFGVQTTQIHNDSTSVKFCGAYAHQAANALQLRRGFSKDHRPDLKQLIYSLCVSADGAIPVHFKAYPGNRTDDTTHLETWRCLGQLFGRTDFLYVADSKLCVSDTLLQLDQEHGRFITLLPRSRHEVSQFAQQAADCQVRWEPLWARPAARRGQRREQFECALGVYQMQEGFRIHWYRSSEKRQRDAQDRQALVQRALQRLAQLNERRGRGPKTEPAIRRAAENLLAKYHVAPYVQFDIELQPQIQFVQTTRGKPSAQSTYRRVVKTLPVVSARQNPDALARAQATDGTFPLVTNTKLSALEVLKKYKYQPHLEKRHCLAKSTLEVAPVFLKNNARIEALTMIYFIAQLVAALIERTLRHNMAGRGLKALALLPEERDSKTPTLAQLQDTFAPCAKYKLYEKDQLVRIFAEPLTDVQRTVLQLLDINPAIYN